MLKVHIRRTLIFAAIIGLIGWLYATQSRKLYEASVEMRAGSQQLNMNTDSNMPLEVRRLLLPGILSDLDSDTGTMRSQRIFRDGLAKASLERPKSELGSAQTFRDLYPMFDLDIPVSVNTNAPNQTRIVRIRVRAYSPEDAASIANNIAYAFSDYRKQIAKTAVRDALSFVTTSANKSKAILDQVDKDIRLLKSTTGIVDINVNQQALTQTVESARSRRSQLLGELYGSQAEAEALNNQLSLVDKKIVVGSLKITDPVIDGMRGNLSYAKNELLAAKASFLDDSTIVKQAAGKVKAAEIALNIALKSKTAVDGSDSTGMNPIYQELKSRASIASSRSKGLQKQLAPIEAEIKELETRMMLVPNMESKYYELLRKRLISEDDYQTNAKLVNMLTSVADNSGSQILSLADPSVISEPVAPEVRKVVILSIIIGSLLGLAYSFMVESFRLPVHTSWQLAELTSLPVAASVPYLPKSLVRRHALSLRENSFKPIESFRFMAFSMISRESKPKVVLFTAVGEEVDSATAAAEFAISMSKTGSKTTLVDFDLRVPRLSDLFEVQSKSGVSDILARTTLPGESIDLIQPTQHENLQILPAGSASASGLADFVTSHLNALIDDLKSKSDILVVNCPPVDVFADASRLAQYVDEVCLVISAKTTSYRAIPVAQEILNKSGAKSVSLILTHASQTDEPFGNRKMSV